MSTPIPPQELLLAPAHREALRMLSRWLEHDSISRFGLRQQLAALDRNQRLQLVRWLAWWCLAARIQQPDTSALARLQRLDANLARQARAALRTLSHATVSTGLPRSA